MGSLAERTQATRGLVTLESSATTHLHTAPAERQLEVKRLLTTVCMASSLAGSHCNLLATLRANISSKV